MDGDDDDDSKLFELDDDDDDDDDDEGLDGPDLTTTAMDSGPLESVNPPPPKDIMIGEEEGGEEEEGMGNHPYNPNDWEDMVGEPEAEDTETRRGNNQDNENGDIDIDISKEDDLNSLMDCGLEEVDDLLSMNGRLRVSGSAHTPSEEASRNNNLSTSTIGPYTGQTVAPRHGTAPTGGGVAQQGDAGVPASGLHPKVDSARGTGAHAANILMSSTAPAGFDRSSFPANHPTPHVSESMLGGSPTEGLLRCNNDTAANNNNGDGHDNNADCNDNTSPNGDEHLVPKNDGPQSYCYDPRQDAAARRGGGGVRLLSPPRRPAKETAPFIRAKGLTLTYAQAKLFGLAGSPQLAEALASKGFKAARKNKRATTGSDTRIFPDENLQDGQGLQRHPQQSRTYSPSRMEHLARPVPGKGRAGGGETTPTLERSHGSLQQAGQRGGGGEEASFTWKRSKKAEAAMRQVHNANGPRRGWKQCEIGENITRTLVKELHTTFPVAVRDPACGYDFVREAGYNTEGFLGRVEAYASYSRQKLETRRGEDLYASRVDKLECPRCHNPQSYDEFVSKKLKCGGCEVPYCMPRTWNRRVWDHRNELWVKFFSCFRRVLGYTSPRKPTSCGLEFCNPGLDSDVG
ncbi:unnamed protein product [Ectocarpus sp. CCAP 1310/34]|nr:unnamed protein product [Ectocarpus sp. CCAP 1310/34]